MICMYMDICVYMHMYKNTYLCKYMYMYRYRYRCRYS